MGIFDKIFGSNSSQIEEFKERGAIVIDVRTPAEFSGGHVKGAKNIPLQSFESRVSEVTKLNKPIILCCASGMRSGQATSILKKAGVECINGGGWTKVNPFY